VKTDDGFGDFDDFKEAEPEKNDVNNDDGFGNFDDF